MGIESDNGGRLARQQAALAEFGERAVKLADVTALLDEAVSAAATALQAEFSVYWDYAAEAALLTVRAGIGWSPGFVGRFSVPIDGDSADAYALRAGATLVIDDFSREDRFKGSSLLQEHGVRSVALATVSGPNGPLGLIGAHSKTPGLFGTTEVDFLRGLAGILGAWITARLSFELDEQVSAAVGQVEREIVTALETPALLDRLCRLTCTALGADSCQTLLLDPEAGTYSIVSRFGRRVTAAVEEIGRDEMSGLLARLDEPLLVGAADPAAPLPAALQGTEAAAILFFLLPRGGEAFSVQAVGFRTVPENKSRLLRVARDLSRLASTLLEYARVVDELKRVSRMKSDFVATMSHELRTPLHVIMGYNDLILEGVLGDLTAEQVESLQQSGDRTKELLALITATLDLSELESGGMLESVNVAALVGDLERETRLVVGSPDLELEFATDEGLPSLRTDRMRLKVVLENVLDNAVKFTESGRVRLHASRDAQGVRFAISDTGAGIDQDTLPLIFDAFQGIESVMRKQPGSRRFGLYAVRRLLHMLGGRISVESQPGLGSTFSIWIPADVTRHDMTFGAPDKKSD